MCFRSDIRRGQEISQISSFHLQAKDPFMWPLLFAPQLPSDYMFKLDNVVFQLPALTQFNLVLETHRDKTKDAVVKGKYTHVICYTHTHMLLKLIFGKIHI